ncbi:MULTISPECIES: hypothetical protein [unclassified Streptomyces]
MAEKTPVDQDANASSAELHQRSDEDYRQYHPAPSSEPKSS